MKKDIWAVIEILKKILCVLNSKQKIKSCAVLFLIILGSLLEMLGVSAILPFVQAILDPQSLLSNSIFRTIAGFFGVHDNISIIFFVGMGLVAIYIIKNAFLVAISYIQVKFRWEMQKELSTSMLSAYMSRPYAYFLDINSSEVLRGIQDDVNSFYTVIENLFICFSNILTILFIGIFLCISDFILAISTLIVAGGCFCFIAFKFRKMLSGVGQIKREANAEEKKYAYQAVTGIKEINVLQRKAFFIEKYKQAGEQSMRANIKFGFLNTVPARIIEGVCVSGIIIIVCFRCSTGMADTIFISKMASFVVAAFKILPLTATLISTVNHLVYYWRGVDETYKNIVLNQNGKSSTEQAEHNQSSTKDIVKMDGNIRLNNVCWKYPNSDRDVLKELSIEIYRGESVALIGKSGAGKTTLADIILGLYRPQSGAVTIDDIDIFAMPQSWSKMIGYVPQQVFLTDDTIRNNIAFGIYEDKIDDGAIWRALGMAQLTDFVKSLPDGLSTRVGERGIKFSGGQRQRVAIARALYYNPEILVFDEATSALDNETETAVMESIDLLKGKKTLLIIAHRLSTITNCDKIYEIVDGKAIERSKQEIIKGS